MTCSGGTLNASVTKPATAVVDGYGTAPSIAGQPVHTRHMQALINLTPIYGNSLNKAIFANSSLQFNNQTTLTGNTGPDADVYTNGNFVCANNQNFAGSVLAQGSITITGTCTIAGDAWAKLARVEHVRVERLDRWSGALEHQQHCAAEQLQRQRHAARCRQHHLGWLLGQRQVLREHLVGRATLRVPVPDPPRRQRDDGHLAGTGLHRRRRQRLRLGAQLHHDQEQDHQHLRPERLQDAAAHDLSRAASRATTTSR